ncbi:16084_t:CDS:2, partial [Acaulospora colombiana]
LEWKIIYVGSSESDQYDQVLDSIMVGPVPTGVNQFIFQVPAPNPERIPQNEILDVTVIIITCSYKEQEFVRVGYYVNNEYMDEELRENPPSSVVLEKLYRNILADKPRVTSAVMYRDSEDETQMERNQQEQQTSIPELMGVTTQQQPPPQPIGFGPSPQPSGFTSQSSQPSNLGIGSNFMETISS